jgi:hypothetical protein
MAAGSQQNQMHQASASPANYGLRNLHESPDGELCDLLPIGADLLDGLDALIDGKAALSKSLLFPLSVLSVVSENLGQQLLGGVSSHYIIMALIARTSAGLTLRIAHKVIGIFDDEVMIKGNTG